MSTKVERISIKNLLQFKLRKKASKRISSNEYKRLECRDLDIDFNVSLIIVSSMLIAIMSKIEYEWDSLFSRPFLPSYIEELEVEDSHWISALSQDLFNPLILCSLCPSFFQQNCSNLSSIPAQYVQSSVDLKASRPEASSQEHFREPRRVGLLTIKERNLKIKNFQMRRTLRNYSKKITYKNRKTAADARPRCNGKFICKYERTIKKAEILR